MAFRVPTFNLTCNIFTGVALLPPVGFVGGAARIPNQVCALVYGQRVNVASTGGTGAQGIPLLTMSLLLPKGADVRGIQDSTNLCDQVECPAGSGRYYWVPFVDDIGKGYANEHRSAALLSIEGSWTAPYP